MKDQNKSVMFADLVKLSELDEEWKYLFNTSQYSSAPPDSWDGMFRIREDARGSSNERSERLKSCILNLANRKRNGENVREFIYTARERAEDESKNAAVLYMNLINDGSPVALLLPGGGYDFVSVMNEGLSVAEALNARGMSAATLVYRTGASLSRKTLIEDLARAVGYLRGNACRLGIDASRLSLWGFSAAGHLAAYYSGVCEKPLCPNALVLGYPVISLGEFMHERTRDNFMRGLCQSRENLEKYSAHNAVRGDYPPTYIWHCASDESVPINNSILLCEKLEGYGIPHLFRVFGEGRHGLGGAFGMPQECWTDEAIDFIRKNVK